MMVIDNKFELGQMVYLKTDVNQMERMVLQIGVRPNYLLYELGCNGGSSWHQEMEISEQKNILKPYSE